ncbi:MAG TPA: RDD family protein [Steroidobacteraceae bacterium]|nr:RDD family protein [Steroidobacteraceae bacterium]
MSQSAPDLTVDSVTGIDVSLAVAGPGARSYAFLIDWHIRLILAFAWFAFGALLFNGRMSLAVPATPNSRWFVLVLLPAAAIYFLYHYVLELAMHGRTPGKRAAGVHIVTRDGSAPGVGALLTRNVFRLIDCLPICYGVGLVAVAVTREHLRIGDMAAGTLLVYERAAAAPPAEFLNHATLDATGMEIVQELLARWGALDPEARVALARRVLSRYAPGEPGEAGDGTGATGEGETLRRRLERLTGA